MCICFLRQKQFANGSPQYRSMRRQLEENQNIKVKVHVSETEEAIEEFSRLSLLDPVPNQHEKPKRSVPRAQRKYVVPETTERNKYSDHVHQQAMAPDGNEETVELAAQGDCRRCSNETQTTIPHGQKEVSPTKTPSHRFRQSLHKFRRRIRFVGPRMRTKEKEIEAISRTTFNRRQDLVPGKNEQFNKETNVNASKIQNGISEPKRGQQSDLNRRPQCATSNKECRFRSPKRDVGAEQLCFGDVDWYNMPTRVEEVGQWSSPEKAVNESLHFTDLQPACSGLRHYKEYDLYSLETMEDGPSTRTRQETNTYEDQESVTGYRNRHKRSSRISHGQTEPIEVTDENEADCSLSSSTDQKDEDFHTAPNTPTNPSGGWSQDEDSHDKNISQEIHLSEHNDTCMKSATKNCTQNCGEVRIKHEVTKVQSNEGANVGNCNDVTLPDVVAESLNAHAEQTLNEEIMTYTTPYSNTPHPIPKMLRLPTPPLIDLSDVQYEVDEKSGLAMLVGKGSFGQVFLAKFTDKNYPQSPLAVKEFEPEYTTSREMLEEAKRLFYLADTGYVPICYGVLNVGDDARPSYAIVQDFVGCGVTLEMMLWERAYVPTMSWLTVSRQLSNGLAGFHEKGILVNDVKTNNIILDEQDKILIKFIDFGLATDMRGRRYKNTKSIGDYVYLAPEVRLGGRTTREADVYSLGYMLDQIQSYAQFDDLQMVVDLCMQNDPEERITARLAATLILEQMQERCYADN